MRLLLIWFLPFFYFISGVAADPASILYPTNNMTFNYNDQVDATYTSPWPSGVNLTLFCNDTTIGGGYCWQDSYEPISQNGTYIYHGIGETLLQYIYQFPVGCYLALAPYRPSEGVGIIGGRFTMISVSRSANTFALSTTYSAPLTASVTTTITATTTMTTVMTVLYSTKPASATSTQSSAASSNSASLPQHTSTGGLSTGAKVGIGVGAGVAALIFVAGAAYLVLLQRRLSRTKTHLAQIRQSEQFPGQPPVQQQYGEKNTMHEPYQPQQAAPDHGLAWESPSAQTYFESDGTPVAEVQ